MERLLTASVSWVIARTSIQVILQNVVEVESLASHCCSQSRICTWKGRAEGALKKPLTPCPAIFTLRELPRPLSLLLVPLLCAHSLLSHASFKEYIFILSTSPALKWEFLVSTLHVYHRVQRPLVGELSNILERAEKPKVELHSILT